MGSDSKRKPRQKGRAKGKDERGHSSSGGASSEETAQPEIKYTDNGYVYFARKWMGRALARHPGAFVVYFHLLAWANHDDGKLKRGQLALGERDFGNQVGMSVLTVRKWLRWLRNNGWIQLEAIRHGEQRGTIVTVVGYEAAQKWGSYATTDKEQEDIFIPKPRPVTPLERLGLSI